MLGWRKGHSKFSSTFEVYDQVCLSGFSVKTKDFSLLHIYLIFFLDHAKIIHISIIILKYIYVSIRAFSVILSNKIKIKLQTNIMLLVYCYDGRVNNFHNC